MKKLTIGSTKPSNFLSTLCLEYQQSSLRDPFLKWTQEHFLLSKIQNREAQFLSKSWSPENFQVRDQTFC